MVVINVEALLSEDDGFLRWCSQKLDGCLGGKAVDRAAALSNGQQHMMAMANMVNQLGCTVLGVPGAGPGVDGKTRRGRGYT